MSNNINNLKYLKSLGPLLQTPVAKQLFFMVGVALSVTIGIVLFMSIQEPTYRPLDYQVNSQNIAGIVDALEKSGIRYKINDRDGMLFVEAKDMQLARLKLSAAGIPKDDGINFAYLNEQGGNR